MYSKLGWAMLGYTLLAQDWFYSYNEEIVGTDRHLCRSIDSFTFTSLCLDTYSLYIIKRSLWLSQSK